LLQVSFRKKQEIRELGREIVLLADAPVLELATIANM